MEGMLREAWRITLLGGLQAHQGTEPVRFKTRKSGLLLARLALSPDRTFTRDELAAMLWPEADASTGRQNLRQALTSLRATLEPTGVEPGSVVVADKTTLRINRAAIHCDAHDLKAISSFETIPIDQLQNVVDTYKGELLPGHDDEWVMEERRLCAELHACALKALVRRLWTSKQITEGIVYAQILVSSNTLDEESQSLLIRLLAEAGRAEDAVQQYRAYRAILKQEYGDEPDPKLRELAMSLKGAGGSLKQPEPVAVTTSKPMAALPIVLNKVFGRQEDIRDLVRALDPTNTGARLITLSGPGGSGKTRLAIETAQALRLPYAERVWFVFLADLRDSHLLLERILERLHTKVESSQSTLDGIVEFIGTEPALLVLDNLEQILPGAAHPIRAMLGRLPYLRVICSSRRALRIDGEMDVHVQPLQLPPRDASLEALTTFSSSQLFIDRARQAAPGLRINEKNASAIVKLCEMLEGIPLAIELAATWAGILSPTEMVERMSERFEYLQSTSLNKEDRHASLWAAIDWSFSLIDHEAQKLFTGLAVFRGGWDLDAVAAVIQSPRLVQNLEILRSHSLIALDSEHETIRWQILESLREFASIHLPDDEKLAAWERHARYFAVRTKEWHDLQRGAEQQAVNRLFAADINNVWAVIDRGIEGKVALDLAYEVANYAYRYWEMRGQWPAARRAYERLLEADTKRGPTLERALTLISLSNLMRMQGELREAIPITEECLAIREQLGDESGVSSALGNLAQLYTALGEKDLAKNLYLKCLDIQDRIGAHWSWAMNCINIGWLLALTEQWDEANEWLHKGRDRMEELGDTWGVAAATGNLGEVALGINNLRLAQELHRKSLELFAEIEDLPAIAEELEAAAHLAALSDDFALSGELFGAAECLRSQIGSYPSGLEKVRLATRIDSARSGADFNEHYEIGKTVPWQDAVTRATLETT